MKKRMYKSVSEYFDLKKKKLMETMLGDEDHQSTVEDDHENLEGEECDVYYG